MDKREEIIKLLYSFNGLANAYGPLAVENVADRILALDKTEKEPYRSIQDHLCYYCGEMTDNLSGNPSRWGIPLCHKDEPGKVKYHHISCVTERLIENQPKPKAELPNTVKHGADLTDIRVALNFVIKYLEEKNNE